MRKLLKKFDVHKNYFLRLFLILILFGLLYRVIYTSLIWCHSLFFIINLVTVRFGYYVSKIHNCYYTLSTGLLCCFLAEILFSILKMVYSRLKGYGRKCL